MLDGIRALTPDAAILSEEAGASGPHDGARWIVDPLDGTVNYAAGLPWFSVTMAYQEGGVTRVGVMHAPAVGMRGALRRRRHRHGERTRCASIRARVRSPMPSSRSC